MKRGDLQTGAVYGFSARRTGIYRYDPVLLVTTDLFMIPRYGEDARHLVKADDAHTKMTSGRRGLGNSVGILVVYLREADHDTVRKVRALMSVDAAMAGINGEGRDIIELVDGEPVKLGHYGYITDPRDLHGDYHELTAELEARARRSRELAQQHEESRLVDLARYNVIAAGLGNLGVVIAPASPHSSPALVKLTFDQAERLLGMAERGGAAPR